LRAHRDFSGMKRAYKGTAEDPDLKKNDVIVNGIYPGSIVAGFFLRRKRAFSELEWTGDQ
jgi:hypothetical protein